MQVMPNQRRLVILMQVENQRGNCVPTILLMMQRRLYSQGGLQSEGIFIINPENGQEEYVREQLNNGLIPDNIDVHCLAGSIKAWFRELPTGILDSLSPEQVMQAQSEDECAKLVRLLPPTESSLMDSAVNLMADVAQLESFNKMNAHNIAVVFATNMTQMSDPLTALFMNFLKTLIVKTMREREDSLIAESGPMQQLEPSDEDGHHHHFHSITKPVNEELEEEVNNIAKEPNSSNESHGFLSPIENILHDGKGLIADVASGRSQPRSRRTKSEQQRSNSSNGKKGTRKHIPRPGPVANVSDNAEKSKEMSIISLVNSYTERAEAWRLVKLDYSFAG